MKLEHKWSCAKNTSRSSILVSPSLARHQSPEFVEVACQASPVALDEALFALGEYSQAIFLRFYFFVSVLSESLYTLRVEQLEELNLHIFPGANTSITFVKLVDVVALVIFMRFTACN